MTSPAAEVIEGLVLCRVGDDRLAIRAAEITAFEVPHAGAPYAGAAFAAGAQGPAEGKLLRHHGTALVVDSVEVHPERLRVLAVPRVLQAGPRVAGESEPAAWGGALSGFVEVGGLLWPVLSLERLAALPGAGA